MAESDEPDVLHVGHCLLPLWRVTVHHDTVGMGHACAWLRPPTLRLPLW